MNEKKYLLITIFIVFFHTIIAENIDTFIHKEIGIPSKDFANLVYRRFYLIERLNNLMGAVIKKNKETCSLKSIKPLFLAWDDFIQYRSLQDQILIEDFTNEVFIISLNSLYTHNTTFGILKSKQSSDFSSFSNINQIVKRYYYLARTEYPIQLLKHINNIKLNTTYSTNDFVSARVKFSNETIKLCIENIVTLNNLKPLFDLWEDIKKYSFIENEELIHEYTSLVFFFYHHITSSILYHKGIQAKSSSINTALALFEKLDSLPLEDILHAIDIMTDELPKINEKFELNSDMSWKEWFRKYWWAPPLILGTIAIKSLMTLQNLKNLVEWLQKDKDENAAHSKIEVNQSSEPSTEIS